ncbi:exported protein [Staphylococcus agnetis]|uniref:DUF4097 family beta strand repeat-containing protein n=1 Tax=Staphylococcus agnetis TaxID=985762 RepID=UPI000DFB544B|nr:DUF4097 family beta strand repeat-containing protein [Staphylococcus agnetis]SUK12581.1 exported protein [Staphylococcus agnetis]
MKRLFLMGLTMFLVFFLMGTLVWFLFESHHSQTQITEKAFKKSDIETLNVNANNADVYVKKGSQFHVKYDGKAKVNISKQNKILQISDSQSTKRHMINVNPFNKSKERLMITVPEKQLDKLNITTRVGDLNVSQINSNSVNIWNEVMGKVNINSCYFKEINVDTNETFVNISQSKLLNSEVSANKGKITVNDSFISKSVLKLNEGSMLLNNMESECDFKGSVNHGDISMRYTNVPKDVMLKLNPENGNINMNTPHLHQGKNGKGTHLIELYTNHGDINIK